jgi:hypothetical protein
LVDSVDFLNLLIRVRPKRRCGKARDIVEIAVWDIGPPISDGGGFGNLRTGYDHRLAVDFGIGGDESLIGAGDSEAF